jgi:O-antigen/teichoic acid export membrane protein
MARNAMHLVLGQVATTALAVVLSAALGRTLGAADFGLYFLVLSMSTFAYVFVEWGQILFVIREAARRPEDAGALLGGALALRVALAVILALPTGLIAWALGYDARTCWLAVLFIASSLPFSLAQAYGMVFRARDQMHLDATVSVTNKALLLAATLAALALGLGIPGVLGAQIVAGLAALALATRIYRRLPVGPLHVSRAAVRFILIGGFPILMMTLATSVQSYLDAIILSKLAPANAVGWYGAARNIMGTLLAPSIILASAIYPRLSKVADDIPVFKREMRSALRPMLWLGALGAVGTYLFADVAIRLIYGARGFGPASLILQVYGPGLFLIFVDVLLGHVITAMGRAPAFAAVKVLSVLAAIGLELWLIPVFQASQGNGGVGVVAALAASELLVFVGSVFLMPRGSLDPAVFLDAARAIGAAVLTAALFHLAPWLRPEALPALGIPVCLAVFLATSAALGLVTRSDLAMVKALVRRRTS